MESKRMLPKRLLINLILLSILGVTILHGQNNKSTTFQSDNLSTMSNATVTHESLRKGMVLHLPFDKDETTDQNVTDASGQENNAKASGVQWTADGHEGGAYEFRADGDQIEVPNSASLNPEKLTMAAWIKTSHKDEKWRRIFDKSYSRGYVLCLAGDINNNHWMRGKVSFEIGPGEHYRMSRTMVTDGKWHHVVGTCDGTEQIIYVDGKPEGRPAIWNNPGHVGGTDINLVIGCNRADIDEDDFGVSFRGLIDEPMLWNRALSPKEVSFLFESQGGKVEKWKDVLTSNIANNHSGIKLLNGVVHHSDNDVRFHTTKGINVFVDPVSFPTDQLVVNSGLVRPDLILITHPHNDHFLPTVLQEYMSLNPKVIIAGPPDVVKKAGEMGIEAVEIEPNKNYKMAGIEFGTVTACFLEGDSHPKSNGWVGYILKINGAKYYVTGDTQSLPEMAKHKVDVIFPLLYGCGANAENALEMAELTKTKVVVPVHHSGQRESITKFIAKLPKEVSVPYFIDGKLISTR